MQEPREKSKPGVPRSGPAIRADVLAVERGLASSREQAQRLLLAGQITTPEGHRLKPGQKVSPQTPLVLLAPERYVSRGGVKLEAALARFRLNVSDLVCCDIGASTGGFTDCLLQHGARLVYAIDVGKSMLHAKLRQDPRVRLVEHTNARFLSPDLFDPIPTMMAMDVSFISVTKILPTLARCLSNDAEGVVLIKPQFEATRADVSRGQGVIRSRETHERILSELIRTFPETGWTILQIMPSPIQGGSGNREYLAHVTRKRTSTPVIDVGALVEEAFQIK